jgi:hypothetical protein
MAEECKQRWMSTRKPAQQASRRTSGVIRWQQLRAHAQAIALSLSAAVLPLSWRLQLHFPLSAVSEPEDSLFSSRWRGAVT